MNFGKHCDERVQCISQSIYLFTILLEPQTPETIHKAKMQGTQFLYLGCMFIPAEACGLLKPGSSYDRNKHAFVFKKSKFYVLLTCILISNIYIKCLRGWLILNRFNMQKATKRLLSMGRTNDIIGYRF